MLKGPLRAMEQTTWMGNRHRAAPGFGQRAGEEGLPFDPLPLAAEREVASAFGGRCGPSPPTVECHTCGHAGQQVGVEREGEGDGWLREEISAWNGMRGSPNNRPGPRRRLGSIAAVTNPAVCPELKGSGTGSPTGDDEGERPC